jgi:hypothetical protein
MITAGVFMPVAVLLKTPKNQLTYYPLYWQQHVNYNMDVKDGWTVPVRGKALVYTNTLLKHC